MSHAPLTPAQARVILREARKAQARVRTLLEDYREACEEDAREGHRPHYCVHGVNMWVDYDCACYRCEDGETVYDLEAMTFTDFVSLTRDEYRAAFPEITAKIERISTAMIDMACITGDWETKEQLIDLRIKLMMEALGRWA